MYSSENLKCLSLWLYTGHLGPPRDKAHALQNIYNKPISYRLTHGRSDNLQRDLYLK